jgi:hypothetical protein
MITNPIWKNWGPNLSERAWGTVREDYSTSGAEMLSETLASVDVRWPAYDSDNKEKSSERSHYILQLGQGGQVCIRVALTRTQVVEKERIALVVGR